MTCTSPYPTCEEFYAADVVVDGPAASEIVLQTRTQGSTQLWFVERRKRVTASTCKSIICRRSADFTPLVRSKLSGSFAGNRATRYGQQHESVALQQYCKMKQQQEPDFSVQESGLVVSLAWPYLAASPDGVVHSKAGKGLVEVKCPYSCRDQLLSSAANSKPSFFLEHQDGVLRLKRTHAYHYQVQFQLLVTGLDWADFVVWTPTEMHVERIAKQEGFNEECLPKVKTYFDWLLPALFAECM